jgi:hypothetical protein
MENSMVVRARNRPMRHGTNADDANATRTLTRNANDALKPRLANASNALYDARPSALKGGV